MSLAGIMPILVTPFGDDGRIDRPSFVRLVEASIADGVHARVMFGLASEYYKLVDAERIFLAQLLVRQAKRPTAGHHLDCSSCDGNSRPARTRSVLLES
jgi:dihydrodipicolinate synthase/N-acetylneuraminate lyase